VSNFPAISTRHFVYKFFEIWNKVNNVSIFYISLLKKASKTLVPWFPKVGWSKTDMGVYGVPKGAPVLIIIY
jgi:hypothetical protein